MGAGVFVLAGCGAGTATFAEREFAALEVLQKLAPLLVGGLTIFRLGLFSAAWVEEASR